MQSSLLGLPVSTTAIVTTIDIPTDYIALRLDSAPPPSHGYIYGCDKWGAPTELY